MNNKEKVIQFLINKYNISNSNPINLTKNDIITLQISEEEAIQILNTLDADHLIITRPQSPHKDFSAYWSITVNTNCLNYFSNQEHKKIVDKRDKIKTYIPIILSIISIIISIAALIISIIKLVRGL